MYRSFWLSNFGNRSRVSADQFVFNLLVYAQIYQSNDIAKIYINEYLIGRLENENFEVNLNVEEGARIVKLSVNAILNEEENPILDSDA